MTRLVVLLALLIDGAAMSFLAGCSKAPAPEPMAAPPPPAPAPMAPPPAPPVRG